MFNKKTVFVIGAGCSKDFQFPLGEGLCTDISNVLRGDRRYFEGEPAWDAFYGSNLPRNPDLINHAVKKLAEGVRTLPSIDRYLEFHAQDQYLVALGKIMIASQIATAESKSPLRNDPLGRGGWIMRLWHAMADSVPGSTPELAFSNVNFICFNYDRCVEYYLESAIKAWLGARDPRHVALTQTMEGLIFHPYGHLGSMGTIPFGCERTGVTLRAMASGIKLFTERIEETEELNKMRSTILEADRVVYLGFGFEKKNMELLKIERLPSSRPVTLGMNPWVGGTVYGVSKSDLRRVRDKITISTGNRPEVRERYELKDELVETYLRAEAGMLAA